MGEINTDKNLTEGNAQGQNGEEYRDRLIQDLFEHLENIIKGTNPVALNDKALESVPEIAKAIISLLPY